jgi:hypothetical protein
MFFPARVLLTFHMPLTSSRRLMGSCNVPVISAGIASSLLPPPPATAPPPIPPTPPPAPAPAAVCMRPELPGAGLPAMPAAAAAPLLCRSGKGLTPVGAVLGPGESVAAAAAAAGAAAE